MHAKLNGGCQVPLHVRCLRYRATRWSSVVGTSQQEIGL